MCDNHDMTGTAADLLSRRQLGAMGAAGMAAAAAACAPKVGGTPASGLRERAVTFATPAGTIDGEFFQPARGRHPGVILWPDIAGIRPAKRLMARRLAEAGHAVLLANPYFRDVAGQQFADFAAFAGSGGFAKVAPWRARFTSDTILADARAIAGWLRGQDGVDTARGIGAQGYCMTGPFALAAPAATAELRAGASFHAAGQVRQGDPRSPHLLMERGSRYLVAIARNDDAKAPGEKDAVRAAADAAGAIAEIEVYPADHGWCVPDSPSYLEAEAERAWTRLLATYRAAL